jgi:hypothetical protein
MKKIRSAPDYVVDLLQREDWQKPDRPYIKPSSLAKGCLLYVAFELQGRPKPPHGRACRAHPVRRHRQPSPAATDAITRLPGAGTILRRAGIPHPRVCGWRAVHPAGKRAGHQLQPASGRWSSRPPPAPSSTRSRPRKWPKRSMPARRRSIYGVWKDIWRGKFR